MVWLATLIWNQGRLQLSTFNPKMGHCKLRPYYCPCPDKGCNWEGSLDQIKLHLKQEHKSTPTIAGYASTFCIGDITLPRVWVAIKSYWWKRITLFLVARKYSQGVNTNLCPYSEWFGWPFSAETKEVCNSLPSIPRWVTRQTASSGPTLAPIQKKGAIGRGLSIRLSCT